MRGGSIRVQGGQFVWQRDAVRVGADGSQEVAVSEEFVAFLLAPLRILLLWTQVFWHKTWKKLTPYHLQFF